MKDTSYLPIRKSAGKILLIAIAAGWFSRADAAVIPPPEKLLPDDTLIVLTAPDFAKVRQVYQTSPQTQFLSDPAMKPLKDKFIAKLQEDLVQPLERELGVRLTDYADLPQGQLTIALTQNGWQGSEDRLPGVLILLDAKEKSSQLKTNIAHLRKKWTDSGKAIKTEKIRDIEFAILPVSEKDMPASLKKVIAPGSEDEEPSSEESTNKAPKAELVIGQYESLLVMGNSTKAVEKIAVHLTGGAMPSLSDLAAFEASRLSLFRDAPCYAWVNAKAFIDIFTRSTEGKDSEADPFAIFDIKKILTTTGIGGIRTLSFAFHNSNDGMLSQISIGVPEASRQGIFKIFPAEPKEAGPPPFVPATAAKFVRYRIDGQKAWATLEKTLNDVSPNLAGALNFLLKAANENEQVKNPDFDIRKNLFGNLGDDLINYEKPARGTTLTDLETGPSLYLIGSPRPDQLASALKSILVLMNQQGGTPTEREFLGRKSYSMPQPQSPMSAGTKSNELLHYAASGSYVALSTDATMLEEYLRSSDGQQKALREAPGLAEATAKVGGSGSGWFGYENQLETARPIWEVLRTSASAEPKEQMLAPGIPAFVPENTFKEWVDFSLLPPFEKVSKYFHIMVYSVGANSDGINVKFYSPVPPGLRK